ncbi:MAG: SDR family oxidoreductase [Ornithinimicrobium sp.]
MDLPAFTLSAFSLEGKSAIVTGGNSGLGRAFTVALAAAGADVLVLARTDDDGSTAQMVRAHGRGYTYLEDDLTRPGAARDAIGRCVAEFGSFDIVVNSAGICFTADPEDFDRGQWDPMLAVNLTAAFEMAKHAADHMRAHGGGKIVNVASLFSYLGGQRSPAYAATKAGIVGFTRAYCDDLAGHNICVNALAPGYFSTAMTLGTRSDPETNRRVIEHIPAGRWGDPADLMGAVVFLASAASDYVNGHTLVVDGGYLVR